MAIIRRRLSFSWLTASLLLLTYHFGWATNEKPPHNDIYSCVALIITAEFCRCAPSKKEHDVGSKRLMPQVKYIVAAKKLYFRLIKLGIERLEAIKLFFKGPAHLHYSHDFCWKCSRQTHEGLRACRRFHQQESYILSSIPPGWTFRSYDLFR